MDLRVDELQHDGVTVLALDGEVDLSTLPKLRDRLLRVVAQQPAGQVVVDLDGVAAIDDTGLGCLVGTAGRLRAQGGDLELVCTSPRLVELLRVTRLDQALAVHATQAAAVAAAHRRATPS